LGFRALTYLYSRLKPGLGAIRVLAKPLLPEIDYLSEMKEYKADIFAK
jgi:hypothetical protein